MWCCAEKGSAAATPKSEPVAIGAGKAEPHSTHGNASIASRYAGNNGATGSSKHAGSEPHARYASVITHAGGDRHTRAYGGGEGHVASHLAEQLLDQHDRDVLAASYQYADDPVMAERVRAAKQALEDRMRSKRLEGYDRSRRLAELQRQLADPALSEVEKSALKDAFSAFERAHMREARRRLGVSDYDHLAIIGRGAFGEVRLVRDKVTHEVAAMKIMRKSAALFKNHLAHIRAEKDALAAAAGDDVQECPNIVRLHASFQDDDFLYLVMDFCGGGDLMGLLCEKGVLPEACARFYAAEAINAIAYIHSLGFIHRDIKPDNFLLTSDGHIKLSDFGLAKRLDAPDLSTRPATEVESSTGAAAMPDASSAAVTRPRGASEDAVEPVMHRERNLAYTAVGTPDYADYQASGARGARLVRDASPGHPALHSVQVLTGAGYGKEVDWWSLGAVLYECMLGFPPFHGPAAVTTCNNILMHNRTLRFPPGNIRGLSREAVHFLRSLLTDVDRRLGTAGGVAEIRAHPWFRGIDWDALAVATPPWVPPGGPSLQAMLTRVSGLDRSDPTLPEILSKVITHFGHHARVIPADGPLPEVAPPRIRGDAGQDAAPAASQPRISHKAHNKVAGYTFKRPRPSPRGPGSAFASSSSDLDAGAVSGGSVEHLDRVVEAADSEADDDVTQDFKSVDIAKRASSRA